MSDASPQPPLPAPQREGAPGPGRGASGRPRRRPRKSKSAPLEQQLVEPADLVGAAPLSLYRLMPANDPGTGFILSFEPARAVLSLLQGVIFVLLLRSCLWLFADRANFHNRAIFVALDNHAKGAFILLDVLLSQPWMC